MRAYCLSTCTFPFRLQLLPSQSLFSPAAPFPPHEEDQQLRYDHEACPQGVHAPVAYTELRNLSATLIPEPVNRDDDEGSPPNID